MKSLPALGAPLHQARPGQKRLRVSSGNESAFPPLIYEFDFDFDLPTVVVLE